MPGDCPSFHQDCNRRKIALPAVKDARVPQVPAATSGKFGMCLETVAVFTRTETEEKVVKFLKDVWYVDLTAT